MTEYTIQKLWKYLIGLYKAPINSLKTDEDTKGTGRHEWWKESKKILLLAGGEEDENILNINWRADVYLQRKKLEWGNKQDTNPKVED